MFQKTYNFVLGNAFLRSSAIVFGSNLLVGVLNYALVIFAARALGVEYSVWTALTGLFAILTTFNTGLYTEVNKKFAAYAKQAPEKALEFYDFLMVRARQLLILGIVLSPLLGVILWGGDANYGLPDLYPNRLEYFPRHICGDESFFAHRDALQFQVRHGHSRQRRGPLRGNAGFVRNGVSNLGPASGVDRVSANDLRPGRVVYSPH